MRQIGVAILLHAKVGRLPLWSLITREFGKTFKGEKQMMVASNNVTSASTDNTVVWHNINWCECNRVVRGYQVRIIMD